MSGPECPGYAGGQTHTQLPMAGSLPLSSSRDDRVMAGLQREAAAVEVLHSVPTQSDVLGSIAGGRWGQKRQWWSGVDRDKPLYKARRERGGWEDFRTNAGRYPSSYSSGRRCTERW
jgi:hypothetical protein